MSTLCRVVCCLCLYVIISVGKCYALEIVTPPQNTKVNPGDVVTIEVVPSPGEEIGVIYFDGLFGEKMYLPPYIYRHKIGPQDLGNILIDIFSLKPESAGPFERADDAFSSSAELHLISTLPDSVKLEKLSVWPTTLILYKLPDTGVDPRRKQIFETEDLSVGGLFSDGYKRSVTYSSGTTYKSSDVGIVTVDTEGTATARKPGRAKIVIANSGKEVSVDVIVKEKDH